MSQFAVHKQQNKQPKDGQRQKVCQLLKDMHRRTLCDGMEGKNTSGTQSHPLVGRRQQTTDVTTRPTRVHVPDFVLSVHHSHALVHCVRTGIRSPSVQRHGWTNERTNERQRTNGRNDTVCMCVQYVVVHAGQPRWSLMRQTRGRLMVHHPLRGR